jgi:F-box interacting protein
VGNLAAEYVVLSRRPCHGFTLVRDARSSEHFVFNLSTGDHAVLPRCEPAKTFSFPTFQLPYNSRFHPTMAPWSPFEYSSTGLGFDTATGEHKVVRLFANRKTKLKCQVHTLGSRGWRPCAGDVPSLPWPGLMKHLSGLPPVVVGGSFYWLLWPHSNVGVDPHDPLILSFSVADERFGWVRTPPRVSMRRRNHRIRHLAELDGSLCAVAYGVPRRFHGGEERLIELLTWTPSPSSWKTRCRIDLATLPNPVRDELDNELHIIVPLCTTAGGKVVLLATGHHKVFAYHAARNTVEKVFSMEDYVDFPVCHSEARLHINICLHEECLAVVPKVAPDDDACVEDKRLQVKLGCAAVVDRRKKHRRLCEKCAALGHGYECVASGWEQMTWTAELRDHLPPRQYIC